MSDFGEERQGMELTDNFEKTWKLPSPEIIGLSREKYKKLVSDDKENIRSLRRVFFEFESDVNALNDLRELIEQKKEEEYNNPDVLAGMKAPPGGEDNEDEELDDDGLMDSLISEDDEYEAERLHLMIMLNSARKLLEKEVTTDNVRCARVVVAKFASDLLEYIADKELVIKEVESGIVVEGEPYEEGEQEELIADARKIIEDSRNLLKKALQADYRISQISMAQQGKN